MGIKTSPGCCCCTDKCIGSSDTFYELSTDYISSGPTFTVEPGLLVLANTDTGQLYRSVELNGTAALRLVVSANCYPLATVGDGIFTQRVGIYIQGICDLVLEASWNAGGLTTTVKVIQIVGGIETELGNLGIAVNALLKIDVNDDGTDTHNYVVALWAGAKLMGTFAINATLPDTIQIGVTGVRGSKWDNLCVIRNHNAPPKKCFSCQGCTPGNSDFPIQYLLSVPDLTGPGNLCGGLCSSLSGDHILSYFPYYDVSVFDDEVRCAWATVGPPTNYCPGRGILTGVAWRLQDYFLQASSTQEILRYRPTAAWDCSGPNTLELDCTISIGCGDGAHWACGDPSPPATLTVVPVFA